MQLKKSDFSKARRCVATVEKINKCRKDPDALGMK
jgi:hypothetical protein